jgi:arginyl-tRNA synthetase
MTIRDNISEGISIAIRRAEESGQLPEGLLWPEIVADRPADSRNGDFSVNIALKMAKMAEMNPEQLANVILSYVDNYPFVESMWVAPPGFINFTVSPGWLIGQLQTILSQGENFGESSYGRGTNVQLEYVSVNPTGPLHVGHARGAVVGSALALALKAAGFEVTQEYYLNDAGNQIRLFAESVYAAYLRACGDETASAPEGGYRGEYVNTIGNAIHEEMGTDLQERNDEHLQSIETQATSQVIGLIRDDLAAFKVRFDVWFSEKSLFSDGKYDAMVAMLSEKGYLKEEEGALWFASVLLGEEKDNVVVRSSGAPTYFATDIAYHFDKFANRKFDRVINIWGADHQGHISRLKAAMTALGIDASRLKVLITQMVTLKSSRMSKRAGDLVTMRQLVDTIGSDACRYFFLSRSLDSHLDFDLDLATTQSSENPVYYIQYAHARICSILTSVDDTHYVKVPLNLERLTHEAEQSLIKELILLPDILMKVSETLEPHHLTQSASQLAAQVHWFYGQCKVILEGDDELSYARIELCRAAQIVLKKYLLLMGISAPEHM